MRMSLRGWTVSTLVIMMMLAVVRPAYAVDGVVLIDQARALAGNVTPGDAPGFPVTLNLPGSYRLSGNLTVPSPQVGITITTSNVTIDLNGFSMTTAFPQSFLSPSRGISFTGSDVPSGIVVRNGTIEGFFVPIQIFASLPNSSFATCRRCTFEHLMLHRGIIGGSASFDLGSSIRIFNVTAPDSDINVHCPSVVTETVARSISVSIVLPGDTDTSTGSCTFAHNATPF